MVRYTIDTNERSRIYIAVAVISVLLSLWLGNINSEFIKRYAAPSVLVIFGILMLLYNEFGWKYVSSIGLSQIPDLNGKWKGKLFRADEEWDVEATITQSWEKIDFCLDSDTTTGNAQVAAFLIENKKRKRLKFIYSVRANNRAVNDSSTDGEGVNDFSIIYDNDTVMLQGPYFAAKGRGGRISLSKVD